MLPPRDQSLLGGLPAYAPLDIEERIDAGEGLERDRRYLVGRFALAHIAGDIGQFEEFAPRMAPAERALDRFGATIRSVEIVVAAIGIRLQYAVPSGKMRVGMGQPCRLSSTIQTFSSSDQSRRRPKWSAGKTSMGEMTVAHDIRHGLKANQQIRADGPRRRDTM
jgi:hypothetical protein